MKIRTRTAVLAGFFLITHWVAAAAREPGASGDAQTIRADLVEITQSLPAEMRVGEEQCMIVNVTALRAAQDIAIRTTVPEETATFVRAEPEAVRDGADLTWVIPELDKDETACLMVCFTPRREGGGALRARLLGAQPTTRSTIGVAPAAQPADAVDAGSVDAAIATDGAGGSGGANGSADPFTGEPVNAGLEDIAAAVADAPPLTAAGDPLSWTGAGHGGDARGDEGMITTTHSRGITTVDVATTATNELVRASVTVAVHDIRDQLVWMEIYVYEPVENRQVAGRDVELLVDALLTNPVIRTPDLQYRVEMIREEVIWPDTLRAGRLPELPEPTERSPDGA